MGDPRITEYYTAHVTLTITLAKAEAEALALFLAATRLREPALAQAFKEMREALADRRIRAPAADKKKPLERLKDSAAAP